MPQPEIAVLVSSFERPGHLTRVLTSLAAQRGVRGAFEVVVTDDGSRDATGQIIKQFAASAHFPLYFVTHAHDGFQLARCRNEGVASSTAPYLLFLDGDCVVPPDHLRIHLDRRREKLALAGYYFWLSQEISEQITAADIESGRFLSTVTWRERWAMRWSHLRATYHSLRRHATRPKLLGGNLGVARADYERVNGYDENFRGWGCEDDDLRLRLRAAGVRVASISWWTQAYHLWHPKAPSAPDVWRAGANVEYLTRPLRLTRCMAGLKRRQLHEVSTELVGAPPQRDVLERLLPLWARLDIATRSTELEPAELQIAFAPGRSGFSKRSDCRVLIVPRGQAVDDRYQDLVRQADLIFADADLSSFGAGRTFPLAELDNVLPRQLGALPPTQQGSYIAPAA